MALYYPHSGYYTSGKQRIGSQGDYYTAPYASSVMSMLIEKQIVQFFEMLGKPSVFYVVEVGAGSGRMAHDIVESAYRFHKAFYNALKYIIVEKSSTPDIQYTEKIQVCKALSELDPFEGCILSNELFDALPVHIVVMKDRLYEVYVDVQDNQFKEILMPAPDELIKHFEFITIKLVEDMWTEVNLKAIEMLRDMASVLMHGYILTIDYGYTASEYYAPHRKNGTLVCYHKHTVDNNPYEFVGQKDITAHVDFTSLAQYGKRYGLKTLGYVKQRDFIFSMGYEELLQQIKDTLNNPVDYYRLVSASKFLIMPEAMGDIFKVLLQYKGNKELPTPDGFRYRNNIL
ncbi:MAG: class I SAM-dependent methyltransferase [bacterium]